MILRTCCAPSPYIGTQPCNKEFTPNSPHQLYCSPACATRAHRRAAKANRFLKRAGLPTPRPGFPADMASRLRLAELQTPATAVAMPSAVGETRQTTLSPSALRDEVNRLEAIDAATAVDGEDVLAALGYLPREDRRGVEPTRLRADVDRAAEPKVAPLSTEEEPPDFRDMVDDADAPLDYPSDEL